jgi:hypothetical protein
MREGASGFHARFTDFKFITSSWRIEIRDLIEGLATEKRAAAIAAEE